MHKADGQAHIIIHMHAHVCLRRMTERSFMEKYPLKRLMLAHDQSIYFCLKAHLPNIFQCRVVKPN